MRSASAKADEQSPAISEEDAEPSGTEYDSSAQEAEQLGGDEDLGVSYNEIDESEGYAEVYKTSEHVDTIEKVERELPAALKLQELLTHPDMYPESALGHSLEPVHARYNGRDMPKFSIGIGEKPASTPCHAVLQVETPYSADMKILNANDTIVKVRYEAVSQTPAICIEIDLAKKLNEYELAAGKQHEPHRVRCWVFGNSIKLRGPSAQSSLEPTHSSLEWEFASNDGGKSSILGHISGELDNADGNLRASIGAPGSHVMETRFDLWSDDEVLEDSHCINVQRTRPVWTGVDIEQIREWDSILVRGDAWEKGNLSAGQIAAVTLLRATHVDIFAFARNGWIPFWETVSEYMLGAMAASAKWGPFWQYFLQAWNERGKSLNHPELDLSKLTVPRNLVTRWKVLRDDGTSKVISAEPVEWAKVVALPIWPTDGAATFLLKLGEFREIQKRKQLVEEALTKPENAVFAIFSQLGGSNAAYHVDLRLPDIKLKPMEATSAEEVDVWSILPGEGESFKITILEEEGLGSGGIFKGKFEDNLSPMAGASLSGTVLFAGIQHDASFQVPLDRELRVKLKLWTDKQAGTNKMNALETLSRGPREQKRQRGPDLPGLIFRTRAYVRNPGELAQQIQGTAGLWEKMIANLNRKGKDGKAKHQLNEEQKRAVELMWSRKKGIVASHGPPGTGKTRTVIAGVEGLVFAGYRVAIVAHANSQVDNAMAIWQETCGCDERKKFARARNGYFEPTALLDAVRAQSEENVEIGGEQSPHAPIDGAHGAGPVLARRINQMSSIPTEAGEQVCKYVRSLKTLKDAMDTGCKAQTESCSAELQKLEPSVLSDACRDVRVWFSTTNSSGHRILSTYSKIDVIVVEEAGLSSTADLAVSLASFLDTAKLVVLAGDHQQQAPICTSSERNEAHPLMEVSRFGSLVTNLPGNNIDVVKLRTQYRGHPDIYQPLSDVFYADKKNGEDGLTMAESTKVLQPKQNFIQRFMKDTFGGAYNGRMRCALSVDGNNAAHTQYGNGTSICNEVEIDCIVRWIKALIAYGTDFKEDGKEYTPIQLSDIGISSPYNGQCKALRGALEAEDLYDVAREHSVEVITASKVQGRQFPVHIISVARHHATDAGDNYFIANRGQCNVQWSRAQLFQLQVGNIGPWAQIAHQKADQNNHKRKFYQYISGLVQAGDIISRSDWEDGLNGTPVQASSFNVPGTQGRNYRGGGGRGGRGRDRGRGRGGKR
ncbi:hypothetical protein KC329_g10571 [Hortaea werneckii]|nr:hypothetical protein KC329_g10571 [Hortaea werneckii]